MAIKVEEWFRIKIDQNRISLPLTNKGKHMKITASDHPKQTLLKHSAQNGIDVNILLYGVEVLALDGITVEFPVSASIYESSFWEIHLSLEGLFGTRISQISAQAKVPRPEWNESMTSDLRL